MLCESLHGSIDAVVGLHARGAREQLAGSLRGAAGRSRAERHHLAPVLRAGSGSRSAHRANVRAVPASRTARRFLRAPQARGLARAAARLKDLVSIFSRALTLIACVGALTACGGGDGGGGGGAPAPP